MFYFPFLQKQDCTSPIKPKVFKVGKEITLYKSVLVLVVKVNRGHANTVMHIEINYCFIAKFLLVC